MNYFINKLKLILILVIAIFIPIKTFCFSRDIIKEQKIESQLVMIVPAQIENFKAGTKAMDQNNLALADSLYSIVYINAPTFDPLIRRLGAIRLQLGKVEDGIALCKKAVSINKSAYNLLSLATCYFYSGKESKNYFDNLYIAIQLLEDAEKLPNGDEMDFPALLCQISIELNDIHAFRSATKKLVRKYPEAMITHYYAAILASLDEDWFKAKDEILIAKKLGLQDDIVQKFLDSGVQSKVTIRQLIWSFIWIVAIWIVGLSFLFLIGKFLSNITISSLEKQTRLNEISVFEQGLRIAYKWIMNFGGVYYYISLPIILILVLALVAGLFYLFLFIGRIPIQLMLVLTVGSGFTIYGMIQSILVKVKYSDPGRELRIEEAPELFKLVNEVAHTIGTRPIDEIRITPTIDLAVYERGSWKEKLQDKAKRILILGIGVLKDFKKDEFCAVLAHEYGHFSHRDTAGGEVAMRVRNDMNKYFYALYSAGQTVWWNIAFQFLRLYNLIFLRISHGSTRLQEVLADRVAAKTFGKLAFQNGLTYVIKREIEFTMYASSEIEEAKQMQRQFNNLYELSGNQDNEIGKELSKALNRTTSEYDTHPCPIDRFRYIGIVDDSAHSKINSLKITDLFLNWEALTVEMTTFIENGPRKI
jgi:Zn-dependent protease with chaperone function